MYIREPQRQERLAYVATESFQVPYQTNSTRACKSQAQTRWLPGVFEDR
jgi:hypothetical protein